MSAMSESAAEKILSASRGIDIELRKTIFERMNGPAGRMYKMLGYFMGFLEGDLEKESGGTGKRFRSALCLLIAQGYGAGDAAMPAAIAIELFHNFTLIHDDVEDHDQFRRNRPTVWRLWGDIYE